MDIAPPSVNLSPLEAILARAKSVMAVTDNTKPIVLSENTRKEIEIEEANQVYEPQTSMNQSYSSNYTNEQVMASNLPPSVKEAMINKRIASPNEFPSALKEDFSPLDDVKMIPNKRAPILKQAPKQIVNEASFPSISSNSDMITLSKTELKQMINESIITFLAQSYNKTLSEEVIKKTMNILIKEGKLTLKKPPIR